MKNLFIVIALVCLIGCGLDAPTEPQLTEEDVARIVAEELAKLDNGETLTPEQIRQIAIDLTLTTDDVNRMIETKTDKITLVIDQKIDAAVENIYQTPQQINKIVADSIVFISINKSDNDTMTGTGFVVRKGGYIATCYHVIEDMKTGTVESTYNNTNYPIQSVVAADKAHDLAILKTDFNARPLVLGNSDTVQIASFIYVVGNPKGWKGTMSEGVISQIRPAGFWRVKDKVFQTTAPTSPGSSGSPVLNRHAEVIAIVYASDRNGVNIHFAIPVTHLKTLLSTLR